MSELYVLRVLGKLYVYTKYSLTILTLELEKFLKVLYMLRKLSVWLSSILQILPQLLTCPVTLFMVLVLYFTTHKLNIFYV